MPFIGSDPETYDGEVVGDGQCVAFIKACAGAPQTSLWQPGDKVKGTNLTVGTAIATFVNGRYPTNASGQHAAIYISQDINGIVVWDQWVNQPVHKRTIRFHAGQGSLSNDGDAFSVITVEADNLFQADVQNIVSPNDNIVTENSPTPESI